MSKITNRILTEERIDVGEARPGGARRLLDGQVWGHWSVPVLLLGCVALQCACHTKMRATRPVERAGVPGFEKIKEGKRKGRLHFGYRVRRFT